jgi:hypothetical protein
LDKSVVPRVVVFTEVTEDLIVVKSRDVELLGREPEAAATQNGIAVLERTTALVDEYGKHFDFSKDIGQATSIAPFETASFDASHNVLA